MMNSLFKKNVKSSDGLNLYYEIVEGDNDKPSIFFLHGIGGDLDAWRFVRGRLLKNGNSSIAMDFRGHGYSDHPRGFKSYKIGNVVEDVASIISAEKLGKIILIGHCFGAVVAEHFAVKYPEKLQKLVLISSTYRPPNYIIGNFLRTIAGGLSYLGAFLSPKPYRPRHSDYPSGKFHNDYEWFGLMKTILHNSLRSYLLTSKEIIDLKFEKELAKIKTPTLVIVGEKDSIFKVAISKKIHKEIFGSKFMIIKGGNHVVILNDSEEVSKIIGDFLIQ